MDLERRLLIANAGARVLDDVTVAIEQSWAELLPAASNWTPEGRVRARRATRAALEGILTVFAQGDLDDRAWTATRLAVFANGHAAAEEVAELLRTVRVAGIDLLADRLHTELPLSHDDRWELQRRATVFCDEILGVREEVSTEAIQTLLSELYRGGADLR